MSWKTADWLARKPLAGWKMAVRLWVPGASVEMGKLTVVLTPRCCVRVARVVRGWPPSRKVTLPSGAVTPAEVAMVAAMVMTWFWTPGLGEAMSVRVVGFAVTSSVVEADEAR